MPNYDTYIDNITLSNGDVAELVDSAARSSLASLTTEIVNVNLTMTADPWPYNNAETTVTLTKAKADTNYNVDVEVLSYSGGRLGNIQVKDRAVNGFKLTHDGSATSVSCVVYVTGTPAPTQQQNQQS